MPCYAARRLGCSQFAIAGEGASHRKAITVPIAGESARVRPSCTHSCSTCASRESSVASCAASLRTTRPRARSLPPARYTSRPRRGGPAARSLTSAQTAADDGRNLEVATAKFSLWAASLRAARASSLLSHATCSCSVLFCSSSPRRSAASTAFGCGDSICSLRTH
ncbi:hypothetical protein T492DRAFT_423502 [Pavlovales sp. CCMP2436]|nr:hypothetical protein T492DRAFT_423502 [Pavlovales sp. CCMP2436]